MISSVCGGGRVLTVLSNRVATPLRGQHPRSKRVDADPERQTARVSSFNPQYSASRRKPPGQLPASPKPPHTSRFSQPTLVGSAPACWPWCKSSTPRCGRGGTGASPVGQPNFPPILCRPTTVSAPPDCRGKAGFPVQGSARRRPIPRRRFHFQLREWTVQGRAHNPTPGGSIPPPATFQQYIGHPW